MTELSLLSVSLQPQALTEENQTTIQKQPEVGTLISSSLKSIKNQSIPWLKYQNPSIPFHK